MKIKSIASILFGITTIHAKLVMVIRHGEKINDEMTNLSPKGEARASCLVNIFGNNGTYVSPKKIYAQNPTEKRKSTRPRDTVVPLADALGLQVDLSYTSGKVKNLVNDISMIPEEIVLVSWSNDKIPDIAQQFGIPNPPDWDSDTFDDIWMISDGTSYSKSQTTDNNNNNSNSKNNKLNNNNGYTNGYIIDDTNINNNSNYNSNNNGVITSNSNENYYDNTASNEGNVIVDTNYFKRSSYSMEIVKQNIDACIKERMQLNAKNMSSDSNQLKINLFLVILCLFLSILVYIK